MPHRSLQIAVRRIEQIDGPDADSILLSTEFERFEQLQPKIVNKIVRRLSSPLDDAARGLGVKLALIIWLAFEQSSRSGLSVVTADEWSHAEQVLRTDEDFRKVDAEAVMESDDIIAIHQPEIARFVRDQVDKTVREFEDEIDLDDIEEVYRLILVEVLALSYAVTPPRDWDAGSACS